MWHGCWRTLWCHGSSEWAAAQLLAQGRQGNMPLLMDTQTSSACSAKHISEMSLP